MNRLFLVIKQHAGATLRAFALLCIILSVEASACADTLPLPVLEIPEFKPVSATAKVDRAERLRVALDRLEQRLNAMSDAEGWRQYFACEDLHRLLANLDELHPRQLAAYMPRYYENYVQCEWPETRDVRTRIVSLVAALETNRIDELDSEYRRRIQHLQELIKQHSADPQSTTAIEIARNLHWLRRAGQGAGYSKQLRSAWAQPNFIAEIGIDTLAPRELDELVVDRSPVVDNILGTAIRGQAKTQGKVSMRLIPSEDSGIFELELKGNTVANTIGVNGPATMQMTSQSSFVAVTRVRMTPDGLIYDPPQASANMSSRTNDLQVTPGRLPGLGDVRRRFVERIALKKAEELKPQADAIATRHSEQRYEKSMAEYVSQALEKSNQPFREKFRGPLMRIGAIYESIGFSTTTEAVQARMLFADGSELGADTEPPTFSRAHSLAFRIHESMLRNAGHMLLRGATIDDRTMAKFMKGAMGEIPREAREYRLGSHLKRWSVTLADEHPLLLDFSGDATTIALRVKQVTIEDHATPVELLVVAKYHIEGTPQGPSLKRLGSVQVVSSSRSSSEELKEMLAFVERKANGFFIPEIWFDGLVPPAGGPFDKYAHLGFKELIITDGWLAMGFDLDRPADDKTAKSPKDKRSVR